MTDKQQDRIMDIVAYSWISIVSVTVATVFLVSLYNAGWKKDLIILGFIMAIVLSVFTVFHLDGKCKK